MKIENQVANLELSKRLKELGYPQKSLWWWQVREDGFSQITPKDITPYFGGINYKFPDQPNHYFNFYSAPTCAELGEMLPQTIFEKNVMAYLSINKHNKKWSVSYLFSKEFAPDLNIEHGRTIILYREDADTEANARAKMLIYLLENKLMEVKDGT